MYKQCKWFSMSDNSLKSKGSPLNFMLLKITVLQHLLLLGGSFWQTPSTLLQQHNFPPLLPLGIPSSVGVGLTIKMSVNCLFKKNKGNRSQKSQFRRTISSHNLKIFWRNWDHTLFRLSLDFQKKPKITILVCWIARNSLLNMLCIICYLTQLILK